MTVLRAVLKGLLRMTQCSGLLFALWLVILVMALPLAVVMEDSIRSDIGPSLIHRDLREGLDLGWLEEFQDRGGSTAKMLQAVRVSPAMVFANLELGLSGGWVSEHRSLAAAAGLFLVIWVLLQGGVLTLVSSPDLRFGWSTLLAAGGRYFFRFFRVALMMGVAYFGVYKLAFWLFPAIERSTRDVTVEKTVLALHLVGVLIIVTLMSVIHLVAEFARIATVREQRRSMVLAILAAARQVGRHPLQSMGVLVVTFMMLFSVQWVYFLTAPGNAGTTSLALLFTFVVGQLYLVTRWALRIARYGAEIELYDLWTGKPAHSQRNSELEA